VIENFKMKNQKVAANLFLPDGTKPDKTALDELAGFLEIEETIERCAEDNEICKAKDMRLEQIAVTPDFHKGSGIPIGTVALTHGFAIPQAMGNDINCGMRFYITDLNEGTLREKLPQIKEKIRHIFFAGGRQIPMTGNQREAMFRHGLTGILETHKEAGGKGTWKYYKEEEQADALQRMSFQGSLFADDIEGLSDFIGTKDMLSYDDQIGSIGGGNHFVEVQRVAEIYDGQTANSWGLKKDGIVFMLHSGSLTIGHHSGRLSRAICEEIYPKGTAHPANKIYFMPEAEQTETENRRLWSTINNAANFGFANRMFLGLMLQQAIDEAGISFGMKLVYDSPHNYIWKKQIEGKDYYLHRKGACSALGMEDMADTPFAYYGEPVMIPGSMGSSSYLLKGMGSKEGLWSASHGAGRKQSRGEALQGNDKEFEAFMKQFHIITPIDPDRSDLKGRRDIMKKWEDSIRMEAPYAYKDIDEVVKVHEQHDMAGIVARMEPVLTVKA